MTFGILGVGTSVPDHRVPQEHWLALAKDLYRPTPLEERKLNALFRKSGVESRYTVVPPEFAYRWAADASQGIKKNFGATTQERMRLFEQFAAPLAVESSRNALKEAELRPDAVTHLITVCCTGFHAPGVDVQLIEQLRLSRETERVQVGYMGCHGAINALRVAQAICASDPQACPLICATELCSLHFQFHFDPQQIVGNALFADGSAALIGGSRRSRLDWRVKGTGSKLFPGSQEAMRWNIGDHGFEMSLSSQVPELIDEHLRPWLTEWLKQQGLSLQSVGSWAIHPGGPRIVQLVARSLELAPEQTSVSDDILREYGNMSSPTVLFIFNALRRARAPRPCVLLAFGPGLVAEVALLI